MTRSTGLTISLLMAASALAGCQQPEGDGKQPPTQNGAAAETPASPGATQNSQGGTITATLVGTPDHSTLVQALKTAGLGETLSGAGPYTVFAPTNAGFQKLPQGAAEGLMRPESKAELTGILTYHVIPGLVTSKDLAASIQRGGGKAQLATMAGGTLTASEANGGIVVTDAKGGQARVVQADRMQANGVVHAIDGVLMPNEG